MTDLELMRQALLLCEWISESPHVRGSINGQAAQVGNSIRARLAQPDDEAIVADSAIAAWNAVGDLMDVEHEPLTDATINVMACAAGFSPAAVVTDGGSFGRFASAIERAHGIGKEGGAA